MGDRVVYFLEAESGLLCYEYYDYFVHVAVS